jgi:hypothetical protein
VAHWDWGWQGELAAQETLNEGRYLVSASITQARATRLRSAGLNVDALSPDLQARVSLLDDDEIAVLESVKAKLNSGLAAQLRAAADTVGGFVW